MRNHSFLSLGLTLAVAGCATTVTLPSQSDSDAGAVPPGTTPADAAPSYRDASVIAPDASVIAPDGSVILPDASAVTPDTGSPSTDAQTTPASDSGGDAPLSGTQAAVNCADAPLLGEGSHAVTTTCGGAPSTGDSLCQYWHPHVYYRVEPPPGVTYTVHTTDGVWINFVYECSGTVQLCTISNSLTIDRPGWVRLEWGTQACGTFEIALTR